VTANLSPMTTTVSNTSYLAPKEAARLLGVGVSTIHRACASGALPSVRLSARTLRIPRSAIEPEKENG
jgi:excisionase family DNA binding protein